MGHGNIKDCSNGLQQRNPFNVDKTEHIFYSKSKSKWNIKGHKKCDVLHPECRICILTVGFKYGMGLKYQIRGVDLCVEKYWFSTSTPRDSLKKNRATFSSNLKENQNQ